MAETAESGAASSSLIGDGASSAAAADAVAAPGVFASDDDSSEDDDDTDDDDDDGIRLVARPPFVASKFARLDPTRFDRIFLYIRHRRRRNRRTKKKGSAEEEETSPEPQEDPRQPTAPRYTVTVVDRDGGGDGDVATATTTTGKHGTVAFLVPAGREAEFMFGTRQGLQAVLESADCDRLLAVATGRDHDFAGGPAQIQRELRTACRILHYRRKNRSGGRTASRSRGTKNGRSRRKHEEEPEEDDDDAAGSQIIPFVTTAEGVGEREVVARGTSALSGEYVVEQVPIAPDDDEEQQGGEQQQGGGVGSSGSPSTGAASIAVARRLYFASNPFVIQSEVRIRRNSIVDPAAVAFGYHRAMVSCLALALAAGCPSSAKPCPSAEGEQDDEAALGPSRPPPTAIPKGLLLGLGGGGLLHYARRVVPRARWVAVELDPEVAQISRKYFGVDDLEGTGYAEVRIGNGLDVRACETECDADADLDAEQPAEDPTTPDRRPRRDDLAFGAGSLAFVVVDVDSKDNTVGMSCPPPDFVTEGYLRTLARLLVAAPSAAESDDGNKAKTAASGGVLVVNVSARDKSLFDEACRRIRTVFPHVAALSPNDDSVNVVVVASLHELPFLAGASSGSVQQPRSLLHTTEGSGAFPADLPEQELRRLFDDLRVWNPLGDSKDSARASNSNKNGIKKRKKKSGKKKR